ncbi:pilus assembly protein [Bifidobacterium thermophilum]|uniref:type II secretion system F family protein n=1 Tax=Bifidobacterium thermophilum TaxID=33905 RepID=UPI0030B4304E
MVSWQMLAAGCCAALSLLPWWDRAFRRWRLDDAVDPRRAESRTAMGLDAALAMLAAGVRAGGMLEEALSRLSGREPVRAVDRFAVVRALAGHARDGESAYLERIAVEVCAAARLSGRLGCELGPCLDAVGVSFRRAVGRDRLVAQAAAMPKATVKLLLALPAGTWAFGMLLGANPLAVLCASPAGWVCLMLGAGGYVSGALWVRAMLRAMLDQG